MIQPNYYTFALWGGVAVMLSGIGMMPASQAAGIVMVLAGIAGHIVRRGLFLDGSVSMLDRCAAPDGTNHAGQGHRVSVHSPVQLLLDIRRPQGAGDGREPLPGFEECQGPSHQRRSVSDGVYPGHYPVCQSGGFAYSSECPHLSVRGFFQSRRVRSGHEIRKKENRKRVGMTRSLSNLILIGMPGSGKSTVGVILAKRMVRDFVDTDVLIQMAQRRPLQEIVDRDGYIALRRIEEAVLLKLSVTDHIIATGGSAVYSERAMAHLKSDGLCIFLDAGLETIALRIGDFGARGIAMRPGQSLAELFDERAVLYAKYADVTIGCGRMTQEEICEEIVAELQKRLEIT